MPSFTFLFFSSNSSCRVYRVLCIEILSNSILTVTYFKKFGLMSCPTFFIISKGSMTFMSIIRYSQIVYREKFCKCRESWYRLYNIILLYITDYSNVVCSFAFWGYNYIYFQMIRFCTLFLFLNQININNISFWFEHLRWASYGKLEIWKGKWSLNSSGNFEEVYLGTRINRFGY